MASRNLTWAKGDGKDEVSRKNLVGGPASRRAAEPRAEDFGTSGNISEASGTSIFDPVLCELAYRWFAPSGGVVIDPFAGGSVRGIVASVLGLRYIGIDLSQRQVAANIIQAKRICRKAPAPRWIVGDSHRIDSLIPREITADLIFSCPPYADLERYSDDTADLSTMDYPAFLVAYRAIIAAACARLTDNRFACFVVGDIRDRAGMYRGFPSDTIAAFRDAGLHLYNEAILVTAVGSLSIRVGKQFVSGRKMGKTHQNVLVFFKGDPKQIRKDFPATCEFGDLGGDDVLSTDGVNTGAV